MSPREKEGSIDTLKLQAMTDSRIDPVLAAWRAAKRRKQSINVADSNPVLRRMRELTAVLGWKDAEDRLSRVPAGIDTRDASKGGPAGLLRLAEMVTTREISFESIKEAAEAMDVRDDDLEPLGFFAFQDERLSRDGTAFSLWRIIAAISGAHRTSAHC